MTTFKELQDAHLALLARQDAAAGDGLTAAAQDYIAQATAASTYIADPGERRPPSMEPPTGRASKGAGEPGVLGRQGGLHLIEKPLLLVRKGHVNPPPTGP
mgnify:CR=1 FL=1